MSKPLNMGREFEAYLELIFSAYAAQNRAFIRKVDPPSAMVGGPGRWRPVLKENPFLDYIGTWTENGGRALVIEAKRTEQHRLPVSAESGVKPAQMASLEAWAKAGAATCRLWSYGGDIRIATYELLALQRAEGRASLAWADAWTIPAGKGLVTHDFLAVLKVLAA